MGNSGSSTAIRLTEEKSPILNDTVALEKMKSSSRVMKTSILETLRVKEVVLASSSPRRHLIFSGFGLAPRIVESTFPEDLPKSAFVHTPLEYAPHTAAGKALEVYRRLVGEGQSPDLVVAADTVVLSGDEILEKPVTKDVQREMLQLVNGKIAQVVTGVTIVYPTISSPGYAVKSICETTDVHFHDNSEETIEAYIETEEALTAAGGINLAKQSVNILIKKIDGDWNNALGFPATAFFRWLEELQDEDTEFLNM